MQSDMSTWEASAMPPENPSPSMTMSSTTTTISEDRPDGHPTLPPIQLNPIDVVDLTVSGLQDVSTTTTGRPPGAPVPANAVVNLAASALEQYHRQQTYDQNGEGEDMARSAQDAPTIMHAAADSAAQASQAPNPEGILHYPPIPINTDDDMAARDLQRRENALRDHQFTLMMAEQHRRKRIMMIHMDARASQAPNIPPKRQQIALRDYQLMAIKRQNQIRAMTARHAVTETRSPAESFQEQDNGRRVAMTGSELPGESVAWRPPNGAVVDHPRPGPEVEEVSGPGYRGKRQRTSDRTPVITPSPTSISWTDQISATWPGLELLQVVPRNHPAELSMVGSILDIIYHEHAFLPPSLQDIFKKNCTGPPPALEAYYDTPNLAPPPGVGIPFWWRNIGGQQVGDSDCGHRHNATQAELASYEAQLMTPILIATEECFCCDMDQPGWNEDVHKHVLDLAVRLCRRPGQAIEASTQIDSTNRGQEHQQPACCNVICRNVTHAVVSKPFLPIGPDGLPVTADKMVDYAMCLRPPANDWLSASLKRFVDGQPSAEQQSFNQTGYRVVKYHPIGVVLATKSDAGGDHSDDRSRDERIRLGQWVAAWRARLAVFNASGPGLQRPRAPILPLLLVSRASWQLYFACLSVSDEGTVIHGPFNIGNTSDLVQAYKLVAVLRVLVRWIDHGSFRTWVESVVKSG